MWLLKTVMEEEITVALKMSTEIDLQDHLKLIIVPTVGLLQVVEWPAQITEPILLILLLQLVGLREIADLTLIDQVTTLEVVRIFPEAAVLPVHLIILAGPIRINLQELLEGIAPSLVITIEAIIQIALVGQVAVRNPVTAIDLHLVLDQVGQGQATVQEVVALPTQAEVVLPGVPPGHLQEVAGHREEEEAASI